MMRGLARPLSRGAAGEAPAVLAYLDPDLRILFANPRCQALLGYEPSELIGRTLADVVDPGTLRYARAHAAALERGNQATCEYVLRHKDGTLRHFAVSAVADLDADGRNCGFYACTAERPSWGRRRSTSGPMPRVPGPANGWYTRARHDLRTPLASVIAALELMRENGSTDCGLKCDALVGMALSNAGRLALTVEQLLELENIESGREAPGTEPVNLGRVIDDAVDANAPGATDLGVRVSIQFRGAVWVDGDSSTLTQVVARLVSFACRYSRKGGIVKVRARGYLERAHIDVEADGNAPGVDIRWVRPGKAKRGHSVTLSGFPGAALELGISRAALARFRGTLTSGLTSSDAVAFHVQLPRLRGPVAN